jgi:hypothetical protein
MKKPGFVRAFSLVLWKTRQCLIAAMRTVKGRWILLFEEGVPQIAF